MVIRGFGVSKSMSTWLLFILRSFLVIGLLFALPVLASDPAGKDEAKVKADGKEQLDYLAIIDGEKIPLGEYVSALRSGMQKRFFHGKIPEEERKEFYKEVADKLIKRFLLVREAKRLNIQPDLEAVDAALKRYDEKFQDNPEWTAAKETVLAQLREKLKADSLLLRLEEQVKNVKKPSQKELEAFYEANKDLFTTPERIRVSLILLRVDPGASSEVWQQAREEASAIVDRLNKGADFAELARIHSSDESARNGGDMGFIHSGMLGASAQNVLDIMEPGETSAPVVMLEGVSIFRLDERVKPKLNSFDVVKKRAEELYLREKGETAWDNLYKKLYSKAKIEVNDESWR